MNNQTTNIVQTGIVVLAEVALVGIYYWYCKKSVKKLKEI